MMKKLLTIALLWLASISLMAQENIHFIVAYPAQEGLGKQTLDALSQKTGQILARCNAAAASTGNPFVVQPELTITDRKKTEGLVRNVTLVTGEFTLTAKNQFDGSIYGTVTITVSGDATGDDEAAITALLSSIKTNNPAFVRFVRTTRQRIAELYKPVEQDSIPTPAPEPVVETPEPPAPPAPQEEAPKPEITPEPEVVPEPVVAPKVQEPEPLPAPEPVVATPQITTSCPNLEFNLVSCEGNATRQSIVIYCQFTNTGKAVNAATIDLTSAFTSNGGSYTLFRQLDHHGASTSKYANKMPTGIKVAKVFEICNVQTLHEELSYVEITLDNCSVFIRNLPITWK